VTPDSLACSPSPSQLTIAPLREHSEEDIGLDYRLPRNASGSSLRSKPSLTSIPELASFPTSRNQERPQSPATSFSNSSNFVSSSDVDLFNYSSPFDTPALTHGSSSGSSRPNSFFRSSFPSAYSSPSVESLIDNRYSLATQVEILEPDTNTHTFLHRTSSQSKLAIDTSIAKLAIPTPQVSPVTPSKVGLGITTADNEKTPQQLPAGRQRSLLPENTRSRSSSVAERVERARMSMAYSMSQSATSPTSAYWASGSNPSAAAVSGPKHRAFGIYARMNEETTQWSLRDAKPVESVVRSLNMASTTCKHLTHLDIA